MKRLTQLQQVVKVRVVECCIYLVLLDANTYANTNAQSAEAPTEVEVNMRAGMFKRLCCICVISLTPNTYLKLYVVLY